MTMNLNIEQTFRELGVAPTRQRLAMARILLSSPQHATAEDILSQLIHAGERISKATVYNTLNLFAQRGLLREVRVDSNRVIYDSNTHPHHHFYNVDTGQLSDIPAEAIQFDTLPDVPPGTHPEGVDVIIRVRESSD